MSDRSSGSPTELVIERRFLLKTGDETPVIAYRNKRATMGSPITVQYRINSGGGFLYVRELILGEIVARVPSDLKFTSATQEAEVVRLCSSSFVGPVKSIVFDIDSFYVTCTIPTKDERPI